jgi:hypothetical protein
VLSVLVEQLDDPDVTAVNIDHLIAATGLSEDDVVRALRALDSEQPSLIDGVRTAQTTYPIKITKVTAEARRRVGAWPTPESLVAQLAAAFDDAANREPDEDKKSKLRLIATALSGAARDVAVGVATSVVLRGTGLS